MNATPAPRRRRTPPSPRVLIGGALVLLAVVALAAWLLRPKEPKDPYRFGEVDRGSITRSVSASGSLQALVTVEVGSQISGQIRDVLVDFNDRVVAGQVMAVLDPQTQEQRLAQSQAEVGASTATLGASQAAIQTAEAQAAVALADLNRKRSLVAKNIYAPAVLEQAEAAYKQAQASVASARANANAQRARVAQSSASLQAVKVDLGRTRIVAPIDGIVVERAIEPGQTVAASLSAPVLFRLAQDLSKLEVKISVDEADIGQVREGQEVRFTVDAFPDENFTGVVTQVRKQPTTEQNVVAYTVIAEADNPRGNLLPGMTANADIVLEQRRNVLRVPAAALRWSPPDAQPQQQRQGGGASQGAGQRRQGQGAGAGGGQRVIEQLGLDADQRKKAEAIFAEAREKARGSIGSGDRQAMREAMRKSMQESYTKLEAILTPEQKTKLAAIRAQSQAGGGRSGRAATTPGTVYVLKNGKPDPIPVQMGATDGSYVEITGPLKPGDQVITGGGPRAKVQLRSGGPMGPSSGPRVRGG
ncbi:MAG: efflux RND transporter periplasmic adaptor subunit [Caulobacteraceae bacterium]|nr:efflux RND transporter periplasmic adaptor subunit [Caulobacteraceae bacterium]